MEQLNKSLYKGLALSLIAIMIALLLPAQVFAETPSSVSVNGQFVYAEPTVNSMLIAVLSQGTPITILDDPVTNGFTHIRLPTGTTGWAVLGVRGVPDASDLTTTVTEDGQVVVTDLEVMALGNVRIRLEPSVRSQQIGIIGWGEIAPLLDVSDNLLWYQIQHDGVTGWVSAAWFEVLGLDDIESVLVDELTGDVVDLPPTGVIVMSQDNVRIRDEASLRGNRLGYIGWGETAELLAFDETGNWILINFDGLVGWASSAFFVIVEGNPGALPITDDDALSFDDEVDAVVTDLTDELGVDTTVVPSSGLFVVALGNVRIRLEPSVNSTRIGYIGWGQTAELLGFSENGEWILINFEGLTGWAAAAWFAVGE